jgi:hypothetical protein
MKHVLRLEFTEQGLQNHRTIAGMIPRISPPSMGRILIVLGIVVLSARIIVDQNVGRTLCLFYCRNPGFGRWNFGLRIWVSSLTESEKRRGGRSASIRYDQRFRPSGPRRVWPFPPFALSDGYRPRGSAPASRTAHSEFNRNRAPATDRSSRQQTAAMSMLRSSNREKYAPENFWMQ